MSAQSPLDELSAYEIRQLASHLLETKEYRTLHRLLELEDSNGENAWFHAKSGAGDAEGYLADINGAWDDAEQEDLRSIEAGQAAGGLSLSIRYGVIGCALADIAEQPAALVAAFVERGLWKPQEAVAYTWQIGSWSGQIRTVTALAGVLDGEPRRSCERRVLELIDKGPKAFPSRSSVGADSGPSDSDYMLEAECLNALAESLPESQVQEGVRCGKQIGHWFWGIHGLHRLGLRLAAAECRELAAELLKRAKGLRARYLRAEACARIVPLFAGSDESGQNVTEALAEAVDVLGDREARKIMVSEPRTGMLKMLHVLQWYVVEDLRPLRAIAPQVSVAELRDALERAKQLGGSVAEQASVVLVPELAARGLVEEARGLALTISGSVYKSLTLAAIVPFVAIPDSESLSRQVRAELDALDDAETRIFCLSCVAPHLPEGLMVEAIRQILNAGPCGQELDEKSLRAAAYENAALALAACPETYRQAAAQALTALTKGSQAEDRELMFTRLVPFFSDEVIEREFRDIQKIDFGSSLRRLQDAWSGSVRVAPLEMHGPRKPLGGELMREVFEGADGLGENQRARLLIIACLA
jgi:hypothetical protein